MSKYYLLWKLDRQFFYSAYHVAKISVLDTLALFLFSTTLPWQLSFLTFSSNWSRTEDKIYQLGGESVQILLYSHAWTSHAHLRGNIFLQRKTINLNLGRIHAYTVLIREKALWSSSPDVHHDHSEDMWKLRCSNSQLDFSV